MKKTSLIIISIIIVCLTNSFVLKKGVNSKNGLSKGTIITLADGVEVSVEEIVVGDQLLTLNTATASVEIGKVTAIHKSTQVKVLKITLANGSELTLTLDNPLLSDKGWVSSDTTATKQYSKYLDVQILHYNLDSYIYTISDKIEIVPIIEIEDISARTDVYAIELDNINGSFIANNIFVGQ